MTVALPSPGTPRISRAIRDWAGLAVIGVAGITIGRFTARILHSPPRLQALAAAMFVVPFLFLVRWRKLVLFTLFWVVFEALLRRYVVNDILMFFIKDLFLAFAYFKTMGARLSRGVRAIPRTPVNVLLAILFVWSVVEMFNPRLRSITMGMLGLRLSFFYLPLMFIAGECFASKDALLRFLKIYVLLGVGVSAFGFIQWLLGPQSIVSRTYLDVEAFYATVSGTVIFRAMGTFASNAAFSEYLLFIALFAVVCAKARSRAGRLTKVQKALVASGVGVGMIATGQAALALLVTMILAATWLADVRSRRIGAQLAAFSVGIVVIGGIVWFIAPLVTAVWARLLMFADPAMLGQRLYTHVFEPIPRALFDSPLGHGLGSQAQGLRYLLGTREAASLARVEGGYAKLAWELGIPGLVLVPIIHALLIRWAWRLRKQLRDPDLRWVAFVGVLTQACLLLWMFVSNSLDHSTFAILFWTTVGIVSALPRLDEKAAVPSG